MVKLLNSQMNKLLFSLISLLAWSGSVSAQNSLSVADMELPQNAEAELVVSFHFDAADTYTGYSFNLELPEQLEFVLEEGTDVAYVEGTCHDASHSVTANLDNGIVKVAGLSLSSKPLSGTDGVLLTFRVRPVSDDFEVGTEYTGSISDILIVPVEGSKESLTGSTFTVTIGEPDDGRIKFNETSTTLPAYTAGEKGNVSMKRTIKANQWSTIVLPFTLTKSKAEAAFGSDVQLAEFSGFEVDYGDDEENVVPLGITINLTEYKMSTKKSMTGGKPFMIKTSQDITSFEADDVSLFRTVTDVAKTDEYDTSGTFTGTLVKSVIPADGLFLSDNKFWYSTGKTNVKAFRCWFELGAVLDKETDFASRVMLHFEDETTGISTIHNAQSTMHNEVYDLSGRKVSGKPTQRGLYIKNGRKVVIK